MDAADYDNVARQIPLYREELLEIDGEVKEQAYDIRFKSGQPVCICGREGIYFLKDGGGVTRALIDGLLRSSPGQLQELFLHICAHSVFSHENEIRSGYVSMNGTYRAGVCGTAVMESGRVKGVRDISTIVFRIPREKKGCADRLFLEGTPISKGVLISGEPSSGKTTFLRDLAFSLSTGKFSPCRRLAVLDERGELGGAFDLGPCADLLQGYPKEEAFDIAIRMLSPQYIICDELSDSDLNIVKKSVFAGVTVIASVHAARKDLEKRPLCRELLSTGAFESVVCLSGRTEPCEIQSVELIKEGRISSNESDCYNAVRGAHRLLRRSKADRSE